MRSSRLCVISLTYIVAINLCVLCVLCVSVVPSTDSPARLYLRIHFTHQTWKSQLAIFSILIEMTITKMVS
ncbi:hypothetical protein [Microcystis sp.]|uniref:hypothetical protein n=1 Tax=Microcystis sp. TaxID=1127 RepID=UPI003AF54336